MSNINRDVPNVHQPAPADDQQDSDAGNLRDKTAEAPDESAPDLTTNPSIKNS